MPAFATAVNPRLRRRPASPATPGHAAAPNAVAANAAETAATQRANANYSATAVSKFVAAPARSNWRLPAIASAALLVLLAGGGLFYQLGILAPARAPGLRPPQPPQAAGTTLRASAQARDF